MPDDSVFDLDAVRDPVFKVKINGEVKSFEPFQLMKSLRTLNINPADGGGDDLPAFEEDMEKAREAFGVPRVDSGELTLSTNKVLALIGAVGKFFKEEVDTVKKLHGETEN